MVSFKKELAAEVQMHLGRERTSVGGCIQMCV